MTIQENIPLSPRSTIHIGGPARFFVAVQSVDDLREALQWADDKHLPTYILGGGSNTLFSDVGFPGLVINIAMRNITVSGREVTAEAGAITRLVVLAGVRAGLTGVEHLAGIPGTIGGAVRGNAGVPGTETKDHLLHVDVLHKTSEGWVPETLPKESIMFSYRTSTFKQDPSYVVCAATFVLSPGDAKEGEKVVEDSLRSRHEKQPYEFPSAGSVFTNPAPDVFAGKLIDETGLKGLRVGGAEVSMKHANFIINRGGATAADIQQLIAEIKKRVKEAKGIDLHEEVVVV